MSNTLLALLIQELRLSCHTHAQSTAFVCLSSLISVSLSPCIVSSPCCFSFCCCFFFCCCCCCCVGVSVLIAAKLRILSARCEGDMNCVFMGNRDCILDKLFRSQYNNNETKKLYFLYFIDYLILKLYSLYYILLPVSHCARQLDGFGLSCLGFH